LHGVRHMITTERRHDAERYYYDFGPCSAGNGYAQIYSSQDAWYYGNWCNPITMTIVNFCQGEVYTRQAETVKEFVDAIRELKSWYERVGHEFRGIDAMSDTGLIAEFQKLGLGDLLH
jgi:hypothetical protein